MQCKDKGVGGWYQKGCWTLYKTQTKEDVISTTEKKCLDQKVQPQSSALRWHSPSALPPKVTAGGTGGPSPPQNTALFCG